MRVGGQPHAPAASVPDKYPVPFVQQAGWAPGSVWTGAENLASTGIRSPNRPARSQSLYRLSCRLGEQMIEIWVLGDARFVFWDFAVVLHPEGPFVTERGHLLTENSIFRILKGKYILVPPLPQLNGSLAFSRRKVSICARIRVCVSGCPRVKTR